MWVTQRSHLVRLVSKRRKKSWQSLVQPLCPNHSFRLSWLQQKANQVTSLPHLPPPSITWLDLKHLFPQPGTISQSPIIIVHKIVIKITAYLSSKYFPAPGHIPLLLLYLVNPRNSCTCLNKYQWFQPTGSVSSDELRRFKSPVYSGFLRVKWK